MKAPQNLLFVKVESQYNDEIETSDGNKLFLSTTQFHAGDKNNLVAQLEALEDKRRSLHVLKMQGGIRQSDFLKNDDFLKEVIQNLKHQISNPEETKPVMIRRHYGTVIATPIKLTKEEWVRQIDPGLPAPGKYHSNEQIDILKSGGIPIDSWSSLNDFVHEWKTCADFDMEVQDGDKIYFHYNTITDGNEVPAMGENVYKLGYHHAICVVRDGIIIPIAGHIIVEASWEEGVQDLGDGKRGKVTAGGIVAELHDKPEYLTATVAFVCKPMKGEKIAVIPGDKIIYNIHADFEVEIEGKKYYVMKYWDILAKIKD